MSQKYGVQGVRGVVFICLVALVVPQSISSDWTGDVNFLAGVKSLKKSDWKPVETQAEVGAEISFGKVNWPVLVAIDVMGSAGHDSVPVYDYYSGYFYNTNVKAHTEELGVGIRKIWAPKNHAIRPYIGAGIGVARADLKFDVGPVSVSDSDTGFGGWANGGVFWRLGPKFNLGLDVRYSNANVTILNTRTSAGGIHYGLVLGWGW